MLFCICRAFSKWLPRYETLRIPAMHISAACCTQNIWEEEEENKLIIYKIIAGFVVVRFSAAYKNNLFATSVQRGWNLVRCPCLGRCSHTGNEGLFQPT